MKEWSFRRATCLLVLLLICGVAPSGTKGSPPDKTIPLQLLFGHPAKMAPQVSPDGKQLAYLAPHCGALNVWVRTIGKCDDKPVTSEKSGLPPPNLIQGPLRTYFWQGDSQHILYTRDQGGDGNAHLYQSDVRSGTTRDLTPWQQPKAKLIAVSPLVPDEALLGLVPPQGTHGDVYRIDLVTGAVELEISNPGDVVQWVADDQLRIRAAWVVSPEDKTELRVRSTSQTSWLTLPSWQEDAPLGRVAGFDAAEGLFVFGALEGNTAGLFRVDSASGKFEVVARDERYDFGRALLDPQTGLPDAIWFYGERIEWRIIDDNVQPDFARLKQLGNGNLLVLSRDRADVLWTVAYQSDNSPTTYYLYDRRDGKLTALFGESTALQQHSLRSTKPVSFTARDGLVIPAYLTLPDCQAARNLPMVLCVHGGPHRRDVWCYDPVVQWLANRGYAVLQVNFRGSTGYGRKFAKAGGKGQWGGRMQSDVIDAKRWAVAEGIADPNRVAIYGRSYGGYAVLAALAFTPTEFACGVDVCGPSIPLYHCGDLQANKRRQRYAPLHYARRFQAPLLVIQGANDPIIPRVHSDRMVAALRACDADVQYLVFPDEGHCFHQPANAIRLYSTIETFLAEHLAD